MELNELSGYFKVLGDPNRLRIFTVLCRREYCVCELVELFHMSQPAVSQHLKKLRTHQFVKERRQGQWIYYSKNEEHPLYEYIQPILPDVGADEEKLRNVSCN